MGWTCPSCTQFVDDSVGKYCPECGTPRPASAAGCGGATGFDVPGFDAFDAAWVRSTGDGCMGAGGRATGFDVPGFDMFDAAGLTVNGAMGKTGDSGVVPDSHKPGDWVCAACGDHQFARNAMCRRCGAPSPHAGTSAFAGARNGIAGPMEPGDWRCPSCNDVQFARNLNCRKCNGEKPTDPSCFFGVKNGDWVCEVCKDFQFAKNQACHKCGAPRPANAGHEAQGNMGVFGRTRLAPGGMKPGDWICASCGDHQWAKNVTCRRCAAIKPAIAGMAMMGGNPMVGGCNPMMQQQAQMMGMAACGGVPAGAGPWNCAACGDAQWAMNPVCRRCGAPRPGVAGASAQSMMMGGGKGAGLLMGGKGGMEPGDWRCPSCGDPQFARNQNCRRCETEKPTDISCFFGATLGDWVCDSCKDFQFAKNESCHKCGAPKPSGAGMSASLMARSQMMEGHPMMVGGKGGKGCKGGMEPGDWRCPSCLDPQFARNLNCRRCHAEKTTDPSYYFGAKPGDWVCESCKDFQFCKNETCHKCGAAKPANAGLAAPAAAAAGPATELLGDGGGGLMTGRCSKIMGSTGPMPAPGPRSKQVGMGPNGQAMWAGDWVCPNEACQSVVWSKNTTCMKCGAQRQESTDVRSSPY